MTFTNEYQQLFVPEQVNYEPIEIQVVTQLLPSNATVLELGGRLGVVSNYINKKLENKKAHVVVEPFAQYAAALEQNKHNNKAEYSILNGAISEFPLFYDSEKTNQHGRDNTAPCQPEKSNVTTYTYLDALRLLPENTGPFTHLVIDCEGSFERFLKENFHHISTWKWIFIELDCSDICDYNFIDRVLTFYKFRKQQISKVHSIYYK